MKLDKPIFVVSKQADVLTEALKTFPNIITIWLRLGKFKNKYPLLQSTVVYEAKSNTEVKDYKKRFVSVLKIPKTHTRLSVLEGISKNQISQLLFNTKGDKLIKATTHDLDYFKSQKTFLSWKSRGKSIYTLINKNGKLFGMIWFNKKHPGNQNVKPEIRIYSPGKGKKIAKKFLEIVCTTRSKINLLNSK